MKISSVVAMLNFPSVEFGSADCKDTSAISIPGGLSMEFVKSDGGTNKYRMWEGLVNLEAVKTLVCWEKTKLDWISEYDVAMAEVWINSSDEVEDVVQMAGASELEVVADDIVIPVDKPLAFTAAVWLWDIGLPNGMLVWKIVIAFVTIKYLSCFESRYDAVRSRRRFRNKKYSRPFCLSYFSRWGASCKISLSWTDFVVGSK